MPEFIALQFSGRAETQPLPEDEEVDVTSPRPWVKDDRALVGMLNERSGDIAAEIALSVKRMMPPGMRVEADILFREGSIEWSGVLALAANVSGGIALGEYASRLLGVARVSIERVLRRHFTSVQPNAPFIVADNDIQVIRPETQDPPTPPAPEPPIQASPPKTAIVPIREPTPLPPEPRRSLAEGAPVSIHLVNTLLLAIILVLLVLQLALRS